MNKPVDPKKPGKVVAVDAPPVPAMPKPLSKWKKFRRLMNDLDEIRERHDDIADLMGDLRNRKTGEPPPDLRYAQLLDWDKQKIARCRLWLNEIDCADHYEKGDDDDEQPILTKKMISERLALMLGAVHIGGPQTPEAFLKMLLEHVYDAEVSYLALESGCRQIEQTEKYVQAITEVLKVLNEHQSQWATRKWVLGGIESFSNNLQEQIRRAQLKYERERAEKRFDEAKKLLERDVWQISYEQGRARQAYQKVEAGMEQLEAAFAVVANSGGDEVVAVDAPPVPALPQSRNEWQQFRRLMNDLDEIRERNDHLLSQLFERSGSSSTRDRWRAQLTDSYKQKIARCGQWLQEIDRTLSEETVSRRLSAMLDMVHVNGPQNSEIFRQNLTEYVYGAEVSFPTLESACREIEQTGKCPTISGLLGMLKEHQERWDKRKTALCAIESVSKEVRREQAKYAGEQLKETEDLLRKRQEEAREAHQRVEAATNQLAKDEQQFDEAKAGLDAVIAEVKARSGLVSHEQICGS